MQLATIDVPDADAWCASGARAIEQAIDGLPVGEHGRWSSMLGVTIWVEHEAGPPDDRYIARGVCCDEISAEVATDSSLLRAVPLPRDGGVFAGARAGLIADSSWSHSPLRSTRLAGGIHDGAVATCQVSLGPTSGRLSIAVDALRDEIQPPRATVELLRRVCRGAAPLYEHRFVRPMEARQALLGRLSPTQRRIVPMLVDGLSEREIGEALGRSMHTIHDHTKTIYRELGVHSRLELRDRWMEHGGI
ncbi:MAG: helix-turn-helix transcriptional regulator [Planctomycetota bacterium]